MKVLLPPPPLLTLFSFGRVSKYQFFLWELLNSIPLFLISFIHQFPHNLKNLKDSVSDFIIKFANFLLKEALPKHFKNLKHRIPVLVKESTKFCFREKESPSPFSLFSRLKNLKRSTSFSIIFVTLHKKRKGS